MATAKATGVATAGVAVVGLIVGALALGEGDTLLVPDGYQLVKVEAANVPGKPVTVLAACPDDDPGTEGDESRAAGCMYLRVDGKVQIPRTVDGKLLPKIPSYTPQQIANGLEDCRLYTLATGLVANRQAEWDAAREVLAAMGVVLPEPYPHR